MKLTRRNLLAAAGAVGASSVLRSAMPGAFAQTGAPAGAPDAFARPKPDLAGPVLPTWESVRDHYHTPKWFREAKVGIFAHWGLYAVPAHHSEWYSRFMYTTDVQWHTEHYGAPDKFGYKDFIPMFKAEKFDADEWVRIVQRSGARYFCPVGEHSDGFAMWGQRSDAVVRREDGAEARLYRGVGQSRTETESDLGNVDAQDGAP